MRQSGNSGREDKYANGNGNAVRLERCDWPRVCWGEPQNSARVLCNQTQVSMQLYTSGNKALLFQSPRVLFFYFEY